MTKRLLLTILVMLACLPAFAQMDYLEMGLRERDHNRKIEYFTRDYQQRANRMALFQRSLSYATIGRVNTAMADLSSALNTPQHPNPNYRVPDAQLHMVLGYCYHAIGQHDRAIEFSNKAIAEDPSLTFPYRYRAYAQLALENHDLAISDLNKAIQADPQDPELLYNMARAHAGKNDFGTALTFIDQALGIDPNNVALKQQKAVILSKMGRSADALALVKSTVTYNEDDPQSLVNVGVVYANQGELEYAIQFYNQAMELYNKKMQRDPGFHNTGREQLFNIYFNRANAKFTKQDYQGALQDFYKASELQPENHLIWYYIGTLHSDRHNFEEAIIALEKSFRLKPDFTNGWVNLGFSYGELGRREDAVRTYNRALQVPNVESRGLLLNNRGFSFLEMGKLEESRRDLEEAIRVDPEVPMSHISLGEYYIEVEKYDEAIAKFTHALAMPAQSLRETMVGFYKRGLAHQKKGDLPAAIRDLEAATRVPLEHVESTVIDCWELLGISYFENNQLCDAHTALRKALQLDSQHNHRDAEQVPLYLQKVSARNPKPCN